MAELMLAVRPKEQLLEEFVALNDDIDNASVNPTWRLADWLAANVPNGGVGSHASRGASGITMNELADLCGKGRQWLNTLRKAATDFPEGVRIAGVAPKVHVTAMGQAKGDVEAALAAIRAKGGKLRDLTPGQDIESAKRILENPQTRAEVLTRLGPVNRILVVEESMRHPEVRSALASGGPILRHDYHQSPPPPPPPPEPVQLQLLLIRVNDEFRGIMRSIRAWSFGVQELAPFTREISDWDRSAIVELLNEADLEFQAVRKAWLADRHDEEPTPAALAQLEQTLRRDGATV